MFESLFILTFAIRRLNTDWRFLINTALQNLDLNSILLYLVCAH